MRFFLPAAIVLIVAACVPVPTPTVSSVTEPPDGAITRLAPGESIAVLDDGEDASLGVASCVQERLAPQLGDIRVLDAETARDRFFPWLEPAHLLTADDAVAAMLAHRAAAQRFADERLRYIFTIGLTEERKGDGYEQGIAGAAFWKLTDDATAQVIDIEAGCCRPAGSARATGVQGYAHVVQWGFIIISRVETAACHELADALLDVLKPAATVP
jgi:hypothetical protein